MIDFAPKTSIIYFNYIDFANSISVIFSIILAVCIIYKTLQLYQVQGQSLCTWSVVQFLRYPIGKALIINPKS